MKPIDFPESNVVFAKDQPEYMDLPAYRDGNGIVSAWKLSLRERLRLLFGGPLWLHVLTFGQPPQPMAPSTDRPFSESDFEGER